MAVGSYEDDDEDDAVGGGGGVDTTQTGSTWLDEHYKKRSWQVLLDGPVDPLMSMYDGLVAGNRLCHVGAPRNGAGMGNKALGFDLTYVHGCVPTVPLGRNGSFGMRRAPDVDEPWRNEPPSA